MTCRCRSMACLARNQLRAAARIRHSQPWAAPSWRKCKLQLRAHPREYWLWMSTCCTYFLDSWEREKENYWWLNENRKWSFALKETTARSDVSLLLKQWISTGMFLTAPAVTHPESARRQNSSTTNEATREPTTVSIPVTKRNWSNLGSRPMSVCIFCLDVSSFWLLLRVVEVNEAKMKVN